MGWRGIFTGVFSILFASSVNMNLLVVNVGSIENGKWIWPSEFRRSHLLEIRAV